VLTDRQIQILTDSRIVRLACAGYNVPQTVRLNELSSEMQAEDDRGRSGAVSPKNSKS